jgi:chromate transporter
MVMCSMQQFLQGYALAQLLPGPLFNISAYIGAAYLGVSGAFVGWVALFLPGLLLVMALLPLWHRFRRLPNVKPFLAGVNATGLGLILAVGVSIYLQVPHAISDNVMGGEGRGDEDPNRVLI